MLRYGCHLFICRLPVAVPYLLKLNLVDSGGSVELSRRMKILHINLRTDKLTHQIAFHLLPTSNAMAQHIKNDRSSGPTKLVGNILGIHIQGMLVQELYLLECPPFLCISHNQKSSEVLNKTRFHKMPFELLRKFNMGFVKMKLQSNQRIKCLTD